MDEGTRTRQGDQSGGAGGRFGSYSGGSSGSMSTVSRDDKFVLSSEDSACPDESELELGLGLSLSRPGAKSQPPSTSQYVRMFTVKDFSSVASSSASLSASSTSSSSSSSSPSSLSGVDVTVKTKRTVDSIGATNGHSQVVEWPPLVVYRMNSFNNHAKSLATEVFNSMVEKSKSSNTVVRKSTDYGSNKNNISAKDKGRLRSSWFVKVSMDEMLIGRKVDLSAHSSYESLTQILEEMCNETTTSITCKRKKKRKDR